MTADEQIVAQARADWARVQAVPGTLALDDGAERHGAALLALVERLQAALQRIAARADDLSGPDIRAHVADALGVTSKDLGG